MGKIECSSCYSAPTFLALIWARKGVANAAAEAPIYAFSTWTASDAHVVITPEAPRIDELGRWDVSEYDEVGCVRALHLTDSHLSIKSEFPPFSDRMHSSFGRGSRDVRTGRKETSWDQFISGLRFAREARVSILLLGGDLLNFASPYIATEALSALMETPVFESKDGVWLASDNKTRLARVPFLYTSGNHDWMLEGDLSATPCHFEERLGVYLPSFAPGGSAHRSLQKAQEACLRLGWYCGGVTCEDVSSRNCTMRKGWADIAAESEAGEISYVKRCPHMAYDALRAPKQAIVLRPLYRLSGVVDEAIPKDFRLEGDFHDSVEPRFSNILMGGVNWVTLDNGNYQIDSEQLNFFEAQIARGLPLVLVVHIPFHFASGPGKDVTETPRCGAPDWGESVDEWAEIERRPKWPPTGNLASSTKMLAVLESSLAPKGPVIAVLSGHEHITYAHPIGYNSKARGGPWTPEWGTWPGPVQYTTLDSAHGGWRLFEVRVYAKRPADCYISHEGFWCYRICLDSEIKQYQCTEADTSFHLGVYSHELTQFLADGTEKRSYVDGSDGRNTTVLIHYASKFVAPWSWGVIRQPRFNITEPRLKQYTIVAELPCQNCILTSAQYPNLLILSFSCVFICLAFWRIMRRGRCMLCYQEQKANKHRV
eukprot:TRINITY_DN67075_c0_g1_i1.p1 TRINITY_DN67075_c0_g1~~TRINITY_DN67075_c0_g1_i1.p1  ORF type:complete len:654 (-),score=55.47 TRINITY_DN67075_c0_g1_i1:133-2094(-)